jgi:hypothetical protein
MWIPIEATTFIGQIHKLFPPRPTGPQTSFQLTLDDILEVGLEVKPTSWDHEHLSISGNIVRIVKLDVRPSGKIYFAKY